MTDDEKQAEALLKTEICGLWKDDPTCSHCVYVLAKGLRAAREAGYRDGAEEMRKTAHYYFRRPDSRDDCKSYMITAAQFETAARALLPSPPPAAVKETFVPLSPDAEPRFNGGQRCDNMESGPCACGAWHELPAKTREAIAEVGRLLKEKRIEAAPPPAAVKPTYECSRCGAGIYDAGLCDACVKTPPWSKPTKASEALFHIAAGRDACGVSHEEMILPLKEALKAAESRAAAAEARAEELEKELDEARGAQKEAEDDFDDLNERSAKAWRDLAKAESALVSCQASAGAMREALEWYAEEDRKDVEDFQVLESVDKRPAAKALSSGAGSRLLDRVKRLEAVAEAARDVMGCAGFHGAVAASLAALDAGEGET